MTKSLKDSLAEIELTDLRLDDDASPQVLTAVSEAMDSAKQRVSQNMHQSSHQTHANHSTSPNRIVRGETRLRRP